MANAFSRWKRQVAKFAAQEAGSRFRDRYRARHKDAPRSAWWRRLVNLGGGVALLLVGAFFAVAPGPAVIFFVAGGLLLANESELAARFLDRVDVLIAPVLNWIGRVWRSLSPRTRQIAGWGMAVMSVAGMAAGVMLMR